MKWFYVSWLLSGHLTWTEPMTLEDCMSELMADKRPHVTARACLPESKLAEILEKGRFE